MHHCAQQALMELMKIHLLKMSHLACLDSRQGMDQLQDRDMSAL
jgi:hypothetical protein